MRGFSIRFDSDLDMRMNKDQKKDAKHILNKYSSDDLNYIFKNFGELKNYKKAETNYEKALKLDPENKIALEYQGKLFVETDRLGLAQVNLNKLKELCPTSCDELEQLKKYINQEAEKTL